MPQYMLVIFNPAEGGPLPEQQAEQHQRWDQYTKDLRDSGLFVSGDALQGPDVATTVRMRDGETQLTDGPFAETKEQLTGFFVFECDDLDQALAMAARIPGARHGAVEVRPLLDMDAQM